jgi:hypothetical protein
MLRRARHPDVGYALLAAVASVVLAVLVLRLWNGSLGVPWAPGGDGYIVLMQARALIDHAWILSNPDLGAPFGQDLHDFAANREWLHVLAIKVLALFSSNPGAVVNAYFLISFPLVAIAAFAVLRWLGLSRWVAVAMAVLYALAPFHFRHQTFLFAYYAAPLAAYLVLAVYSGAPLFERRAGGPRGYLTRRSLLTLGVCAVVALSSFYFAVFTVILVTIAGALAFAVSRRRSSLGAPAAIVTVIVVTGLLASVPDLIYRVEHGANPEVGKRAAQESELYGTNILQLVMPVPEHRVGPLRELRQRWDERTTINGEPTNLGLIAALGFVWLLVLAVAICAGAAGQFARDPRQRHLAVASLTALLVGTTGGVSAVIAYLISPQIRAWTRLSIVIAFFALAAIGLLLDAGYAALRRRGVRVPAAGFAAVLAVICAIAVLDQTSPAVVPDYEANAAAYHSDGAYVDQIERTLDDDAMVFQLPYVQFPESGPVGGAGAYDHVRPYLHSTSLRWSFGAMSARPEDWQTEVAGAPPRTLLPTLAAVGFAGVHVDRSAYPDGGRAVELELAALLDTAPIISPDNRFAFFDIRAYGRDLRARSAAGELEALADATLHPPRSEWSDDFGTRRQEGVDAARWMNVPEATVTVTNPSDSQRSATLFVKLARPGGEPGTVTITLPDGSTERAEVTPDGVDVERTAVFPPGESTIRLSTEAPPVITPEGGAGYVNLVGWQLSPVVR